MNIETIIVLSTATDLMHYIDPGIKACTLKYNFTIFEIISLCKTDK